jgi:hypothetical protein
LLVSREEFLNEFQVDLVVLPHTTCLLGWSPKRARWLVHGFGSRVHGRERLDPLIRFCDRYVRGHLEAGPFWFFFNHWDGWREGAPFSNEYQWVSATTGIGSVEEWQLGPGEIPILSNSRRWVACFGAHHDDPSAVLLPEAHFLSSYYYRPLFARMSVERVPWSFKRPRGVFAGKNHGPTRDGGTARQRLHAVAAAQNLAVDVYLGRSLSRRAQIAYKYLLDVDGWVRTWDAWAWKLASGSVVLSAASKWRTFFTELFSPWEHFVPIASDFADLAQQLTWCHEHDRECRQIARQAKARVAQVYQPRWAGEHLASVLSEKLSEGSLLVEPASDRPS